MIRISDALTSLGITGWSLEGEPTNEIEFNSQFKKTISDNGIQVTETSSNPDDFGVTWAQVSAKKTELENAEPLKILREERNKKLAETDWTQSRDVTLTNDAAWQTYRQALRDITDTYSDLDSVVWPTKPE